MKDQEKHQTLGQFRQNIKQYQQQANARLKQRQEDLRNATAFNEELRQLINTELHLFAQLQKVQKGSDINKYVHVQKWTQIQADETQIQEFIRSKYRCCYSNKELDQWFQSTQNTCGFCVICMLWCLPCYCTWKCVLCCADAYDYCLCDCCCKCSCNTHQYSYYCCCCSDCCLSEEMRKWKQLLAIYKKYSPLVQNS